MTLRDGTPIWFELATADRPAATDFYARVVGWVTAESPAPDHRDYVLARAPDGERVAGIMSPPPPGAPGGWSLYLLTHDLEATLATALAAGGKVAFGPMDIPHVGRVAVLHDPQGIVVSLMQPEREEPGRPFKPEPGAIGHGVWIELATPAPEAAFAFYGALFGWTREGAMPMGEMGEYAFMGAGEARPGAIMSSALTGAPARWNVYFLVDDIDRAIDAAQAGGGTLIQGPDAIPGGDYSANILDPAGHQIGLVGPRP